MQKIDIPGFILPHIERFVLDRKGDNLALFTAAGINIDSFNAQQDTLSEDQFYAFINEAVKQSAEPAFGLEIERRFGLGSLGLVSRAIMSCVDVHAAVQLAERYSSLVMPLVRLTSQKQGKHLVLEINALSRYPNLNRIILEAMFIGIARNIKVLTGGEVIADKYTFSFAEPAYVMPLKMQLANNIEFNSERNLMFFKIEHMQHELLTANSIDAETATEACEVELIRAKETLTSTDRVIDLIRFYLDTNPSSKDISKHMNTTERTLRRKLAEEGTSYRVLLRKIREETARYYLDQTQLQVAQIALKLGYGETSNFRAAFKGWTGKSPREWRKTISD